MYGMLVLLETEMMTDFSFASAPHIHFGAGKRLMIPQVLSSFGKRVLLVTGSAAFDHSDRCQEILLSLDKEGFEIQRIRVHGEPSPSLVDAAVQEFRALLPDCVLAVGGGSAVDAAKAIAGLLPLGHSVMEYLEGVGRGKVYPGPSLPFVAVPTTAGTGGETSKNAVLSVQGEGGYKKSFRDDMLVAHSIIVDPELTLNCPPDITAACGLDAFTQLLESYVSSKASPMTDALAMSGMQKVRECFMRACRQGGEDIEARAGMAYAAFISGLTLANAGLGSVHGIAAPLGAYFPIPHGVACGTLLAQSTRVNIHAMLEREPENPSLGKYADVGRMFHNDDSLDDADARVALLELLERWTEELNLPRLGVFGIDAADVSRIVSGSRGNSMQTNPVLLSDEEISSIVASRL